MSSKPSAADFLKNMTVVPAAVPKAVNSDPAPPPERTAAPARPKPVNTRANLKHIGGYFDAEMVEKVAVLRARLKLDNSELIKLAIEDLFRKQGAKRAFGD
jgi:hypothetical protein